MESKDPIYINTEDIMIDGEQMTEAKLHEIIEDAMEHFYKSKGIKVNRMPFESTEPSNPQQNA